MNRIDKAMLRIIIPIVVSVITSFCTVRLCDRIKEHLTIQRQEIKKDLQKEILKNP
ncbi:hypothetical protein [Sebaldella sp. S0638]|uniref:hypothetical protein n=1 Tax=Sebaldella sp. S0638 TaxID=2957809 RepID=UPI0020A0E283|nr:hypothetical protein [Sebaldella sp. S0638]MCP1226528.1 hypothetical protein [Sebaldella sp. S0638]